MSKSSAIIALHGPTLTLRPPGAADAPRSSSSPATRRSRAGSPGGRTERRGAARLHRAPRGRARARRAARPRSSSTASTAPRGSPASASSPSATAARWSAPGSVALLGHGRQPRVQGAGGHLAFESRACDRLGSYTNPANVRSSAPLLGSASAARASCGAGTATATSSSTSVFGMLRAEWQAGPLRGRAGRGDGAAAACVPRHLVGVAGEGPCLGVRGSADRALCRHRARQRRARRSLAACQRVGRDRAGADGGSAGNRIGAWVRLRVCG